MPLLGSYADSVAQSLRLPAQKRISTPTSVRLSTITEGTNGPAGAPPIPRRSSRRNSPSNLSRPSSRRQSNRWSGTTEATQRPPPPYGWSPDLVGPESSAESETVVDERFEKLRSESRSNKPPRRGGWIRAALIAALVVAVVIALGVGLGVGLSKRKKDSDEGQNTGTPPPETPLQKFPLGQYSLDTALRTVATDCTSNPATWTCYPYVTYSSDGSTDTTSIASFNWLIKNSSTTYATNETSTTSADGVPANLTVSASSDPFGITFTDKPLTYISDPSNSTSSRYTFSFTMSRRVIPSSAITTDNSNAVCFFNQTIFTADIYLAADRVFPDETASMGGYEPWPYAVEITQTAAGGNDVPDCYETVDGQIGQAVTTGFTPQSQSAECMCDYRSY